MQNLVNSILALTKISAGNAVFQKFDLNPLLEEIRIDMEEEMEEKKVTLILEQIPPLFVNPGLMRQLFQNLIDNAIKYRKNDLNSVIKIYAEVDFSEIKITVNANCSIFVEDNGIGFRPEIFRRNFRNVKQATRSTI
jgi:two-component system sensor kinase FixL